MRQASGRSDRFAKRTFSMMADTASRAPNSTLLTATVYTVGHFGMLSWVDRGRNRVMRGSAGQLVAELPLHHRR